MAARVSLSFDNYPHLWDLILSYASTEVQRNVRLVSRSLRSAVDRRVRHLLLTAGPPTGSDQCDVAEGALASAYDWKSGMAVATFPDLQLISAWADQLERSPSWGSDFEDVAPWGEQITLTSLTRTVDLRGYFHEWLHLGRIGHLFPRLDTLRLTQDTDGTFFYYIPFTARTLMLFPSPKGLRANLVNPICKQLSGQGRNDDEDDIAASEDSSPWPAPPRRSSLLNGMLPEAEPDLSLVEPGDIPLGISRIIVNLEGHVGNAGMSFHFLYNPPEHVTEIVFVLPRLSSLDYKGTVNAASPMDLVEVMRSSTAKHVVVGADCVNEVFAVHVREALKVLTFNEPHADVDYSIDDEITRDMSAWHRASHAARGRSVREHAAFHARLLDLAEPAEPSMSLQQKIDHRLGRLEFVTVEEYTHRVGKESATLHLIQYPGSGRKDASL